MSQYAFLSISAYRHYLKLLTTCMFDYKESITEKPLGQKKWVWAKNVDHPGAHEDQFENYWFVVTEHNIYFLAGGINWAQVKGITIRG